MTKEIKSMKVKFEFDLENPEDRDEYNMYNQAFEMKRFISEFAYTLKGKIKHMEVSDQESEQLENILDDYYNLLSEHNIDI